MKPARNGIVSAYKLIAACAVVFIHFPFPGAFGKWVDCLARFAVPLFFAISGYYAYRVDAGRLVKRLKKLIALAVTGYGAFFLWECLYRSVLQHKGVGGYVRRLLKVETLAAVLFMEEDPFYGHLWYLAAMVVVYIVYILYTRFWKKPEDIDYTPLYCVAACGFLFQIAFGMKLAGAGLSTDKLLYRNSLYLGIPMFALGLFLNQYRERLLERYGFNGRRAAVLIAAGFGLSLVQWFGIRKTAMPAGMLLVVGSLLLLANSGPDRAAPGKGTAMLCRWAEISSTVIYLFHPLVEKLISKAGKGIGFLDAVRSRPALYPLFILFTSMALGVLVSMVREILRKKGARS